MATGDRERRPARPAAPPRAQPVAQPIGAARPPPSPWSSPPDAAAPRWRRCAGASSACAHHPAATRRGRGGRRRPWPPLRLGGGGGVRRAGGGGLTDGADGAVDGALGGAQAPVRVDGDALGGVDLDVDVGHRSLGVAAVAHPADLLAGGDAGALHDAGQEPPRPVVGAVVGAGRVVVHVVRVVAPAVVATDRHAPAGGRMVEDEVVDDAVVHGEERLEAVADQVVALVRTGAVVTARTEVVDVGRPGRRRGT